MTTEMNVLSGGGGVVGVRADLNNELYNITTRGGSWEATEDCVLIAYVRKGSDAAPAAVYIGATGTDALIISYCPSATLDQYSKIGFDDIGIAIPKGTVVRARSDYGYYDLHFYAIAT